MRHKITRCEHCGRKYTYLASGWNLFSCSKKPHMDDRYCPECYEVVEEALSKVPIKVKFEWVPTDDVTLEQLLEQEKADGRRLRRIWPGLIDMENGDEQYIRQIVIDDVKYRLSTWEKDPSYAIEKEIEVHL